MQFVISNIASIVIGLSVVLVVALVYILYIGRELRRVRRMYRVFMTGSDNKNLEEGLLDLADKIKQLEETRSREAEQLRKTEHKLGYALQRTGMVRFNAFADAGGELSFALALLDDEGNGVVLSSIYGRAEARVYGKQLTKGKSAIHLSTEEEKAIAQAMRGDKM